MAPCTRDFILYVRLYSVRLHSESRLQQVVISTIENRYVKSIDIQSAVVFTPWFNKGGRKPDTLYYNVQDTDLPYPFPYTL